MLGAPVSGLTVANTLMPLNLVQGLSNEYSTATANLYTGYTGSTFTVPALESASLVPGKGFIWYLFTTGGPAVSGPNGESTRKPLPITFIASGTVTANVSVAFSEQTGADAFYLGANPFPAAFTLNTTNVTASSGTVSSTFQTWDPNASPAPTYVPITSAAPWQGFFVQVTGGTSPVTITYKTTGVAGASATFVGKNSAEAESVLSFHLNGLTSTNVATYDEMARLYFSDDASAAWDQYDASKLEPLVVTYATIAPVGASYNAGQQEVKAQESLPLTLTGVQQVPLAFTATTAGTYTLTWPTMENLPSAWGLTLTDGTTGTVTNLRTASQYRFTSEAATEQQRFVVTITPSATTATEAPASALALTLSAPAPNPSTTATRATVTLGEAAHVTAVVYDVLGRAVLTVTEADWSAGAHALSVDAGALPVGTYVLRVATGRAVAQRTFSVLR